MFICNYLKSHNTLLFPRKIDNNMNIFYIFLFRKIIFVEAFLLFISYLYKLLRFINKILRYKYNYIYIYIYIYKYKYM